MRSRASSILAAVPRANSAPVITLSATDISANGWTTWNVRPMPSRHVSYGGRPSMRLPSSVISPRLGRR